MEEQTSIPKHKLARAGSLTRTGLKIGVNYARYYGRKTLTGVDDREGLHRANAEDSYATFSKLKGGPLKVAQMLSIDNNLLPAAYAEQFAQAQYSAPPLSYPLVARTFRKEFGKSPTELFDTFTQKAAYGASIGQVHKATTGEHTFAVKVQYPGVAESLRSDIRIIKPFALKMFNLDSKLVKPYFAEIEERLMEETDYRLELKRGQDIAGACHALPNTRFPKYFPEMSSQKILTMEWMPGDTLDKFADGPADAAARNHIGQLLWNFYDHQIHTLFRFHADPHPGNFLVDGDDLIVLDFGCLKQISESFHDKFFAFLEPGLPADRQRLRERLQGLSMILPGDSPANQEVLLDVYSESIELLTQPFQHETFNFGDPAYGKAIIDFGERCNRNKALAKINSARGPVDAIYLNRAYFGLYNLLIRLKAEIAVKR